MRFILPFLLLAMMWPAEALHANPAAAASFDAMVVLSVTDLDDATLENLRTVVGKSKSSYMEYSCVWSGVVVIKFSDISVGERSDVITLARRLLSEAGMERGVEVVYVHVEARGEGKC